MFYGRNTELELLQKKQTSKKSELIVIYGRRRIGKSHLINKFLTKKKYAYSFEAIEGEPTSKQIQHFTKTLKSQFHDSTLDSVLFKDWDSIFLYITEQIITKKQTKKKYSFSMKFNGWQQDDLH